MKRFSRVLFVLMSVLLLMSFVGCSEDDVVAEFTVTYDSQSAAISADPGNMSVVDGETVATLPTAPVKTDYVFGGWINSSGGVFDATTVVTADITLYA